MSTGHTAPRRTRRRNQARGKWIVASLLVVALIGIILTYLTQNENDAPSVLERDGVTDVTNDIQGVASDAVDSVVESGTSALESAVDAVSADPVVEPSVPTAVPPSIREPLVTNAVIGYDADGNELLTVSGSGDERCSMIRFILDGNEVGTTTPDADGSWALTLSNVPTVGNYMSELECEAVKIPFSAAPRAFELQAPPAAPAAEAVEEDAAPIESPSASATEAAEAAEEAAADVPVESDPATNPDDNQAQADVEAAGEAAEATDDNSEAGSEGEDSAEPAAPPVAQPTFFIAQDLSKYVGGPLLLSGEAAPNTVVELVFDNGTTRIVDTARANEAGKWTYRGMLSDAGDYAITAQVAGTSAEATQQVNVPQNNFGSKGDCVGKVPPFGTISDNTYTVNFCEYFSLIADRLGVTFGELQAANPQIVNLDYLTQGDVLNIPTGP